jgi:hypothetical protein
MGLNLPVRWLLANRGSLLRILPRIVGNEGLAGFVRMEIARLLAEGFGQLVLRRVGLDTKEVVEGDVLAFGFGDLVAEAEDFMVWRKLSAESPQSVATGCIHTTRRISGPKVAIERERNGTGKVTHLLLSKQRRMLRRCTAPVQARRETSWLGDVVVALLVRDREQMISSAVKPLEKGTWPNRSVLAMDETLGLQLA